MTDRELLELAAKAHGGIMFDSWGVADVFICRDTLNLWNPLTDDGDALRLAVKLGIGLDIDIYPGCNETEAWVGSYDNHRQYCHHGECPYAATRRAIVRAAASIGEQK